MSAQEFHDFAAWMSTAERVMHAVCRIELVQDGTNQSFGTGFLIAPARVITCYHVVHNIARLTGSPLCDLVELETLPACLSDIRFRFGYFGIPDSPGRKEGQVCKLAKRGWCVASEPHWRCEVDGGAPGECPELPDKCRKRYLHDFLVLESDGRPGDSRGWLTRYPIQPQTLLRLQEDPLLVVQHPGGEPMAFSNGHILGLGLPPDDGFVLLHDAKTRDASSGSPCLSIDWKVVAIHQGWLRDERVQTRNNPGLLHRLWRAISRASLNWQLHL